MGKQHQKHKKKKKTGEIPTLREDPIRKAELEAWNNHPDILKRIQNTETPIITESDRFRRR